MKVAIGSVMKGFNKSIGYTLYKKQKEKQKDNFVF